MIRILHTRSKDGSISTKSDTILSYLLYARVSLMNIPCRHTNDRILSILAGLERVYKDLIVSIIIKPEVSGNLK